MAKDLFAPPTNQELTAVSNFAPPTKEELGQRDEQSLIDKLISKGKSAGETASDFITGAGRGAVSGALPLTGINTESLAGGVGAAGDVLTGENPLPEMSIDSIKAFGKRLGVAYDEAKKFADRYKQQQEQRSPIASGTGELTGGFVGGGTLMKGLGTISPALGELGSGQAVGKALGIAEEGGGIGGTLARTGAKVIEGAPIGAVYGADASPDDKLAGAAKGAAMGSAVGLGAGLLYEGGKGLNKLYQASKNVGTESASPTVRQLQLARTIGREGVTTPTGEEITSPFMSGIGKGGAEDIVSSADKLSTEATEQLYGGRQKTQELYGNTLKSLDDEGTTLIPKSDDLLAINQGQNVISGTPGLFNKPGDTDQTLDLLNKFSQGILKPSEAKQLQMNLRTAKNKAMANQLGEKTLQIDSALNSVTDQMNSLPIPKGGDLGYRDLNNLFKEYHETMGSIVNKGETDPNYVKTWIGELPNRTDIKGIMSDLVDYVAKPGADTDKKRLMLQKVQENFSNLEKTQPELLEHAGIDFNKITNDIQKMSDIVNVSRSTRMESPGGGIDTISAVKSVGPTAAFLTGKAEKFGKYVAQGTQRIFNLPDEVLRTITPSLPEHIGSALSNAINTGDTAKKNAVLFSIMQNPDLRKRANGVLGINDGTR